MSNTCALYSVFCNLLLCLSNVLLFWLPWLILGNLHWVSVRKMDCSVNNFFKSTWQEVCSLVGLWSCFNLTLKGVEHPIQDMQVGSWHCGWDKMAFHIATTKPLPTCTCIGCFHVEVFQFGAIVLEFPHNTMLELLQGFPHPQYVLSQSCFTQLFGENSCVSAHHQEKKIIFLFLP